MATRINTPWGLSDDAGTPVAPGITFYSTPSHGGYLLSADRRAAMPEPYRSIKTFAGSNWYEEDCDWSLVALSFPECFPATAQEAARATFAHFHAKGAPDAYRADQRAS